MSHRNTFVKAAVLAGIGLGVASVTVLGQYNAGDPGAQPGTAASPGETPTASPTGTSSPGTASSIVSYFQSDPRFSTLASAIQAAGLASELEDGPYTVFAPTNDAFAKLPPGTLNQLLQNTGLLRELLRYHVIRGAYTSAQLSNFSSLPTLEGESVTVSSSGGTVRINSATVTLPDQGASNGVIHGIDTVLIAPGAAATATPTPTGSPGSTPTAGMPGM